MSVFVSKDKIGQTKMEPVFNNGTDSEQKNVTGISFLFLPYTHVGMYETHTGISWRSL